MTSETQGRRPAGEPPTEELVLKRNPVERLKREKSPLVMRDELPALIATGYADVAEEDVVRLKWWGLYHDKPKIGTFMLRIKLPAGRITAPQLRTVGELSVAHGKGAGELTTRQTIQLHHLELGALPTVFEALDEAGLVTVGACGDAVRNVTGCPVAGLAADELFDVTPVIEEVTSFFYGHPEYSDLPRKHKISISACAHRCNAPEINCISLVGVLRDGEPGFGILVGGGLSSVPRIARDLGVWIPVQDALPVLRALLDAWREDLRYRVSRVKARLKFMVDDLGPEGMLERIEERLGRTLVRHPLPAYDGEPADHLGIEPEHGGRMSVGLPVHVGLVSGEQLLGLAELLERHGHDARVTRQQNLVLTGIEPASVPTLEAGLAALGLPRDLSTTRGRSIACTGEPHCNFAVAETKTRLDRLVVTLEERFGDDLRDLHVHLDGCPHACGHHWVGELGFQGTTARDADGTPHQAYDVLLRGSLGPDAAIGRPVFRRVPSTELEETTAALVGAWVAGRAAGESFRRFVDRHTDTELGVIVGREPARRRGEGDA